MSIRVCVFLAVVCLAPAAAGAATLRVCASGCPFTSLQPAIDAAAPGDTILLAAGQTFVGNYVLRAKPGSSWITIRSDASDASLPPDGVRLVPSGLPGGNTARQSLARLLGQGGLYANAPVVRAEPGAHHYILKFLEIDGSASLGFETLVAIGENTTAAPPYDIVLDRLYVHGHATKGQKRGIALNSVRTAILNSYIADIKAVGYDSQAICGFNGAGPFRIENNYLEAAGENIMFGGADPVVTNLVPADIDILRNHIFKPLSWRNPILAAPAAPRATASANGALGAGTHYFRVVALMDTGPSTAVSVPSLEVPLATGNAAAALVSWTAVAGADRYRIYRGASPGGQGVYIETGSAVTSFTYTGSGERPGTPPAAGTLWVVKNLFELKNAERVRLDGNLIENIWAGAQSGYAIVLTPRNQDGRAPWSRVRDVTIANNIIRHAAGGLHVVGYDSPNVSQQTQRITVRNNLLEDIGPGWGGGSKVFLAGEGVASLVIDRNTVMHGDTAVMFAYGAHQMTGFVFTNNAARHGEYGIMGDNGRVGTYSINMYFPGAVVAGNVLAEGVASLYPAGNSFPTLAEWAASFANPGAGDYRLLPTSPFYSAGTGGSVPGADFGAMALAMGGSGGLPVPKVPAPPTAVRVRTN